MYPEKRKEESTAPKITPQFHQKKHGDIWFSIGSAIILISVIIAIILGYWSSLF